MQNMDGWKGWRRALKWENIWKNCKRTVIESKLCREEMDEGSRVCLKVFPKTLEIGSNRVESDYAGLSHTHKKTLLFITRLQKRMLF